MAPGVEPEFVGQSRKALVAGLVALVDEVCREPRPRWVSLEAPSGWGKTRVARELYGRLAAGQPLPHYWPPNIVEADGDAVTEVTNRRKRVNPDVVHTPGSLPSFTWWGISCSMRNGVASVALAQDAAQLESHAPFLEDAWLKLPRTSLAGRDARAFGAAVLDEAAMEVGGRAVEAVLGSAVPALGLVRWVGEWAWGRAKEARERRDRSASADVIAPDHSALGDSLVEMLTRLSRPGLPTVLFVEDLHDADELLLEVLGRIVASRSSVLVITTGWPGHLDESPALRETMLAAGDALVRITPESSGLPAPFPPGAGLGELGTTALEEMLRFYYPQALPATARMVVERYPNPLALELFCQIPGIRRRYADRPLDLTEGDLSRLPSSIRDLYRQLWKELPETVRQALAIATLGIPAVLDPETGRSQWWHPDLLARAITALGLPDAESVGLALRDAPTAYAWARVVSETLRQFAEPDQMAVAGDDLEEFLMPWETDELKNALASHAAERLSSEQLPGVEREHLARLLLALHSEGFVTDPAVVGSATRELLHLLREQPRELAERTRLARRALELLPRDSPTALDIRRFHGEALRKSGHFPQAESVLEGLQAAREAGGPGSRESLLDAFEYLAALSHTSPERCAEQVVVAVAEAGARLGPTDELTLRLRNLHAVSLWNLERHAETLRIDAELLELRTETLGADHPQTLMSANNLADALIWLGRYDEAHELVVDTLTRRMRVLGPGHEDTLLSRQELARLAGFMGRTDDAVRLRRELLADKEEFLGSDHPATLWAMEELAAALADAGAVQEAMAVQGERLERGARLHGPGSAELLEQRTALADLVRRGGEPLRALELHEAVLRDARRLHGDHHRETHLKRHFVAHARIGMVPPEALLAEFRLLHEDVRADLGPYDPVTVEVADNLAHVLQQAGRTDEAVAVLEGVWRLRRAEEPPNLRMLAGTLNRLASCYLWAARPAEAEGLLDDELPFLREQLGDGSEEVIRLRAQRASCMGHRDPEGRLAAIEELLPTAAGLPRDHVLQTDLRLELAVALGRVGRQAEAADVLLVLARQRMEVLGAGHPDVTRVVSSLLQTAAEVPEALAPALAMTGRIVDAARAVLGTDSPVFRTLLELASKASLGDMESRPEVLGWRRELVEVLGSDASARPVDLAVARTHLGLGLLYADRPEAALEQFVTGADVLHRLQPAAEVTVAARRLAAITAGLLERWEDAIRWRRQQVAALEAAEGIDPEELATARDELSNDLARVDGEAAT